eukprot:11215823-Lingulodinium_polyedra.AAC.1
MGQRSHVRELRASALIAPELPGEDELEALEEMPVGVAEDPTDRRSGWLGVVCVMRDELRPCGLQIDTAAGPVYLKVLYCKKQPYEVHCLRVER